MSLSNWELTELSSVRQNMIDMKIAAAIALRCENSPT